MYKIMSSFSKNSALFLLVYVALKAQLKTHRYFIDYKWHEQLSVGEL